MAITAVQDWDNDGFLVIKGEGTLTRYSELKEQMHTVSFDKIGIFAAFSNEQFKEGYDRMVRLGHIKDGDKVYHLAAGCYGTKEGFERLSTYYEDIEKLIRAECDPQEVYYYEYNNFECCIAYDGDFDAMKQIILTFGVDAARNVRRLRPLIPMDEIISRTKHKRNRR